MKMAWPLLASTLLLGACSPAIVVTKLDPSGPPPKGVPWNVPMTQYTLAITRQVTSCSQTLNAKISIAVTQGKAVDPSMRYVLSSSGVWATSDITSGLAADGTSTSLNAQSQDQTATVISNIITTAAQIAVMAASSGAALNRPYFQCSDAVSAALLKLDPKQLRAPAPKVPSLSDIVDADNAAVATATARVTQLVTDLATNPSVKHVLALSGDDLAAKKDKLNKDQAELTATLKLVQNVQTVVWPPDGDTWKSDNLFTIDEAIVQKWLKWVVDDGKGNPVPYTGPLPKFDDLKPLSVSVALYRPDGAGGWTTARYTEQKPDLKIGVPVRVAGLARLMVCTGISPCPATRAAGQALADNESLPIKPDVPVLQSGQTYMVPVTGGTFKSELAAINLDANGNPTSIQIAEKIATAAAATGVLSSALTQVAGIPGQIATAKLTRTQSDTAQINAENALIQAQANAGVAGATSEAVAQGALATAQANLATARATALTAGPSGQLALVTAQNNLAVAQATADANAAAPGAQSDLAMINTKTTLLTAQANSINAETALAKARTALAGTP